MFDPESFGAAMGDLIRDAVAPLLKRIGELEDRPVFHVEQVGEAVAVAVKALPPAAPGKDAPPVDVESLVKRVAELIPKPENGLPGKDAPAVDLPALAKAAAALVPPPTVDVEAIAKLVPKPANGTPGKDAPAVDVDAIVKRVVELVPPAAAGKDGLGLAGAMIDRDGALQITLTNGETKSLGRVVGKDGTDGISFDAFELEYLPESHEMAVKATVGARTKELRYPAGGIRPAGYWRDGTKAKAAEAWVHDGSTWIAIRDTASKPESKGVDWIIAARKGRDGETTVKTINAGPVTPIKLQA